MTWVLWLDVRYGDGAGSIGPALWEALAQPGRVNEPDVLDAWDTLSGDWRVSLLEFAAARARIGTDAGMPWTALAGADAYAWREGRLDVGTVTPTLAPFPLGTSYWDVDVVAGEALELTLAGDPSATWGLVLVEGDGELIFEAPTGAVAWTPGATGVATVAVVNLGPPGMDGDDPLEPASFSLTLGVPPEPEPEPEPEPDAELPAEPDVAGAPATDGCGCGGSQGSATLVLPLLVGLLRGRRRGRSGG